MKKLYTGLFTMLISLMVMSGYAFAGTETLTHFGISLMRTPDKTIDKIIQVNGSLMPSVEREMIPYSDWKRRAYGWMGYEIKDHNYGFGVGYYLGRVGMVSLQVGLENEKGMNKDRFVYGIYLDGNVFKGMLKGLAEMAK